MIARIITKPVHLSVEPWNLGLLHGSYQFWNMDLWHESCQCWNQALLNGSYQLWHLGLLHGSCQLWPLGVLHGRSCVGIWVFKWELPALECGFITWVAALQSCFITWGCDHCNLSLLLRICQRWTLRFIRWRLSVSELGVFKWELPARGRSQRWNLRFFMWEWLG